MARTNKPSDSDLEQKGLPCDACGSSDALALYSDGHTHCFSCNDTVQPGKGAVLKPGAATKAKGPKAQEVLAAIESGEVRALTSRKITQATCRHWDYLTRTTGSGHHQHLAIYRDKNGSPQAIKVRDLGSDGKDKEFFWIGPKKDMLFGQWLWGQGGKMVVVTEGEIDALSVSQLFGNKWPVVSVSDGAAGGPKAIANSLEWLNSYEKVILAFDMDEPGRLAATECAKLLQPGKAFIAHLSGKDANAMLVDGQGEAVTRSIWNAKAWRPDGIVNAKDLIEEARKAPVYGQPWPWEFLTEWTFGRRYGEVYSFGAGTGVGKSDFLNTVVAHTVHECKEKFAAFNYESAPVVSLKAIAGKIMRRRFHIPHPTGEWSQEELDEGFRKVEQDCADLFLNDSFGVIDWESVKERARYLARAEGVRHVLVDPLTALAAVADDERKALEKMMAEAAGLAQELQICLYLVSHLATPEGASHEEGGRVMIKHFKGSRAIGFWSHFMFGLERDQQAEEVEPTTFRCLKDRFTGLATGKTMKLHYDPIGGMLEPETLEVSLNAQPAESLEVPSVP